MVTLNWDKIRNEYINGYISYRKLAEKHDIPYQTLRDRASKEKWFDKRKEQREKIGAKTAQKTAEKIAEQESDLAANIYSAANELLEKLKIAIAQTDTFIEKTQLRVPKKVKDKATGETYTAWQTEEQIRLTQKEGFINIENVLKLTNAIRSLQSVQTGIQDNGEIEAPKINITIAAATPADIEGDD